MTPLDSKNETSIERKPDAVSTIVHELRTPLTIIREFVSMLYDELPGPINDKQRECLESALRNCGRMAALINDILDMSTIESQKLKPNRQKINIKVLIDEIVRDYTPKCEKKSQILTFEREELLPDVLCVPKEITQVLLNLLSNARRYTPEGGHITVKADSNDTHVIIRVIDTGIGISQNKLSKIYDEFVRLYSPQANSTKGTGLGLAISKNLIELNGGEIHVRSQPGKGSEFSITIPIYNRRVEYEACLFDAARSSIAGRKPLSLVLIRLISLRMGDGDKAKWVELSDDIRGTLRNNIKSSTDYVLSTDKDDVIAVILETDRDGSRAVADRLMRVLYNKYNDKFIFASGQYTFTDDRPTWPAIRQWIMAAERELKSNDRVSAEV